MVTDLTHEVVDVRATFNSYPRSLQASLENNRAGPLVDVDHQTWTESSFQHDFPYIQPDVSDKKYVRQACRNDARVPESGRP